MKSRLKGAEDQRYQHMDTSCFIYFLVVAFTAEADLQQAFRRRTDVFQEPGVFAPLRSQYAHYSFSYYAYLLIQKVIQ